jgi:hypothetical protein
MWTLWRGVVIIKVLRLREDRSAQHVSKLILLESTACAANDVMRVVNFG